MRGLSPQLFPSEDVSDRAIFKEDLELYSNSLGKLNFCFVQVSGSGLSFGLDLVGIIFTISNQTSVTQRSPPSCIVQLDHAFSPSFLYSAMDIKISKNGHRWLIAQVSIENSIV